MSETTYAHTNRLIHETSPYLLQHAHNPVDWHPWGAEALEKARRESKPLLLSIGYAACHWCHVMEHESFEDEETARMMNALFVPVKVDREERPDLDTIYMQATQLMSGHGGWPMTVFLTPDQVPFYCGTYFPPQASHGLPGFRDVLLTMSDAWRKRPDDVQENARKMREALERMASPPVAEGMLDRSVLDRAAAAVAGRFDERHGGFGHAPKFPQTMVMSMLLRDHARTHRAESLRMVAFTLQKMARGGIYDQLGGGFARYSVDEYWLVPHFEKMLYDNALLVGLLTEAWQITRDEELMRILTETVDYVLRDMTGPEGGFYATEDADSEGEEGRFYVWTPEEIAAALGDEQAADRVCRYYDVGPHGNFERGRSILNVPEDADVVAARAGARTAELLAAIAEARPKLLAARSQRVRPGRDEKVIAFWNGLMLDALAKAAAALDRADYAASARRSGEFLLRHLWVDGHVMRVHKDGRTRLNGYLEDYAGLAHGLLSLYEASFETRWFEAARAIADRMLELFWDPQDGGFFFTSSDHEQLITRFKDPYDNATPSGTSVAVTALLRLAAFTGEARYRERAESVLRQMRGMMEQAPMGFGWLLCALDMALAEPLEIALVGTGPALRRAVFEPFLPHKAVAGMAPDDVEAASAIPLLEGKAPVDGHPAAYVCHGFTCRAPVTDPAALSQELRV